MVVIMAFGPEVGAFREWFTLPDTVMIVLVVVSIITTFIALFSYFPGAISQFKERFSAEGRANALAEKNAK